MISRIKLDNIAAYGDDVELIPQKINYIFGGNGTGKTSISKLLHTVSLDECSSERVEWNSSTKEKILVFNRFFIKDNFEAAKSLDGVFTLGEDTIKYQQEITELEERIANSEHQIETYNKSLENLSKNKSEKTSEIEEKCWSLKLKYGGQFPRVFEGYMNSKSKFAQKIMSMITSDYSGDGLSLDELRKNYEVTFISEQVIIPLLPEFDMHFVNALSDDSLIGESIIGSSHGQIGELIKRLNSADWVKGGIHFAHEANGICPYCQQPLSQTLQNEIEEYFDESYKNKCALLVEYLNKHKRFLTYLRDYRSSIPQNTTALNYEQLQDQFDSLITIAERNILTIEKKIDNPSQSYSLLSFTEYVNDIKGTIKNINDSITSINRIVSDKNSKEHCKDSIWMFCALEISSELTQIQRVINGMEVGIKNIKKNISELSTQKQSWQSEIHEIESHISSVKPTVKAINELLAGFGFDGFKLEENNLKSGTYRIVRPDGTEAKDTLSEGEYNFISFLYFYHLCFGSTKMDDISREKIVVIDDPISSLDSNVLFIVSSLTKDILRRCKEGRDHIAQAFVLTHNAYFYKEVTYWGSREQLSSQVFSFYVIRKKQNTSYITQYDTNPIRNTYESMWDDIKNPRASTTTICNTMRRILEHYFNIVGGMNYDKCIDCFTGQERIICKSLISFVNDGSHSIFDDYTMFVTDESLDVYLRVFELIFKEMGHSEHYSMMMKRE